MGNAGAAWNVPIEAHMSDFVEVREDQDNPSGSRVQSPS